MVLAGVMFALDLGCWHYGIRYTSVANATLLPNLNPVLVTAGAWILLKERPRPIFLVGMAAAVLGAGLVAVADRGHGASGANTELGDALSASTAVWYAFYFLAVRGARAKDSTLRIMGWTSLVGAPLRRGPGRQGRPAAGEAPGAGPRTSAASERWPSRTASPTLRISAAISRP